MTNQIENIQYVTSHFQALQGLRIIPLGLLCLAALVGNVEWIPWPNNIQEDWTMGTYILMAALLLLYWGIVEYYRHQFGEVVHRQKSSKTTIVHASYGVAFIIALILDTSLGFPVSFTWLVIAAGALYSAFDGSRRSGHLLLGIIITAFAFWPLISRSAESINPTAAFALIGIGIIFVGIYDHLILVKTLRAIQQQR